MRVPSKVLWVAAVAFLANACSPDGPTTTQQLTAAPRFDVVATTISYPQLDAGGSYACVVKTDHSLICWGDNNAGKSTPPPGAFIQVSAGFSHACALRIDQSLACWGLNSPFHQAVPPTGSFTEVSVGTSHSCALRTDGTVSCWGSNTFGQSTPPVGVFAHVSAGSSYTCGLRFDASLSCWGVNSWGQATPPDGQFAQVSASNNTTCTVKADLIVACWGYNPFGQATPPAGNFTAVSGGGSHTCGLKTDHTLACWGSNAYGQAAPPPGTFTQVSSGGSFTCAVKSDGTLACWGQNDIGQTQSPDLPPHPVNNPPTTSAGGPYSGHQGAAIPIAGSASDADGNTLAHQWAMTVPGTGCIIADPIALSTAVTCPNPGDFTLRLIVNDGTVEVTSEAGLSILNAPPVANAGVDQTIEATSPSGASVTLDGSSSADPDGDPLTYAWTGAFGTVTGVNPVVSLPIGTNAVTLTVSDGDASSSSVVHIKVQDTTAPTVGALSAGPNVLGAPNHQMIAVNVTAACTDAGDPTASCKIVAVSSNEPVNGLGDGDTAPDWQITGDLTVTLRAERSGQGNGRVYTITLRCTDASGNSATKTVTVSVPKNQGKP